MTTVDSIAKRHAEATVQGIVNELARDFFPGAQQKADREAWLKSWSRRFRGALVGTGIAPEFTDQQISEAYEGLMQGWKYNSPPKPAHIAERARELRPLQPMQKQHTDPTPQRTWTPEERQANIRRVEAIQAFLDSQEPEFREALREYGYGSDGLAEVCARHKRALAAEIGQLKKDQQIY